MIDIFDKAAEATLTAQFRAEMLATYGRTGFSKILYGSIAQHVLQQVTIPILLLRTPT